MGLHHKDGVGSEAAGPCWEGQSGATRESVLDADMSRSGALGAWMRGEGGSGSDSPGIQQEDLPQAQL